MIDFATSQRCALRAGHAGDHLFVTSKRPDALLGECTAAAPSKDNARALTDVEVAKILRKELKAAFPAVKFSVRCDHSVRVSYTNGPTVQRVEAIVATFEGKQFDGMTDSTSYKPAFLYAGEWVYTYCYIFVNRDLSPAFVERVATAVASYYDISKPAVVSGFVRPTIAEEKEIQKHAWTDWGTAIHRAARDRSSVCRATRDARMQASDA